MTQSVFAMTRPVMQHRVNAARVYLEAHREHPVPAIELATYLGIGGNHEARRRIVRRVVEHMHDAGLRVCADCHPTDGGYWLADGEPEWRRYQQAKQGQARFQFVRVARIQAAVTDRISRQGRLFE